MSDKEKALENQACAVGRMFTLAEAAKRAGLDKDTMLAKIESGEIEGFDLGGRYGIMEKDLNAYLEQKKQ